MRYIPTTPLRSTLLALLLTLCLALPALAAQKEGLLLVAFGTSVPEAQPALTAIDKEFKAAFPTAPWSGPIPPASSGPNWKRGACTSVT